MLAVGADLLLSLYQSRTAVAGATGVAARPQVKVPTSPWAINSTAPQADALVKAVMAGRPFIQPDAVQLDVKGASADYKSLFGLYQGLNALNALAERASLKTVSSFERSTLERRFAAGMSEVDAYLDTLRLEQLRLVRGESMSTAKGAVGVPRDKAEYVTRMVHEGRMDAESPALTGDVRFSVNVRRSDGSKVVVPVDLADMSGTRSFGNLINFLNGKMHAAGLVTRFDRSALPSEPRTVTVGGKTVTLPDAPERWAMKVVGVTTETVSFDAPESADAVYLVGAGGKADVEDGTVEVQRFLKFQTDVGGAPPPALQGAGEANWVVGRAFSRGFGPDVAAVRSTATGADGSVYVLADVTATTAGQTLQGEQDVALLKYDSAGKLLFTRTLGAGGSASGLALAVSTDGKVAVAGSVTGELGGVEAGRDDQQPDSFVTLYDAEGQELWTRRRSATAGDEARAVAFGADGTVYVGGRARSAVPGATAVGGWDGYLQSFRGTDGTALASRQFGTTGTDGVTALAVQGGTVVVGGTENGRGVLRRFTADGAGALTAGTVRDLGDLAGGAIAGVGFNGGDVVVAGASSTGGLSAGTITTAYAGGRDGFVARLSADLAVSANDRLSWFGGGGDDAVTAMTVKGGQVYLAGSSTGALPGSSAIGARDGFLVRLDPATGAVGWSRRFTDQDGRSAPTSIAVGAKAASVLDRLGLPKGTLDYTGSRQVTAATSVRAGDQFLVRTREGATPVAVTIAAGDTLQTLALKVNRALGFNAQAVVVRDGDVDRLQIKPRNERTFVEILPGKGDRDALASLGLTEGVVRHSTYDAKAKTDVASEEGRLYGLKLGRNLNLSDPEQIKHASAELAAAMVVIRTAYRDLKEAATPAALKPVTGQPSAYMQRQIAGYEEALRRLGG